MAKIIFVFLVIFKTTLFSQEVAQVSAIEPLNALVKKMFVDINNKDYDAVLDMTHPKVFEIVPKAQMKTMFVSMFEGNGQFSVEIPKTIPDYKLSEVFKGKEDSLAYAFTSYDMGMKMTFHDQEYDEESKKMMKAIMKTKGMDVDFISNNAMNVMMYDRVTILIKDNDTANKWVMINYDPDAPLFYNVVPTEVMEKAKTYKQDLMLARKKKNEE